MYSNALPLWLQPHKNRYFSTNYFRLLHLAHIINPFEAEPSSDLFTAQPITFQSMINAKEQAKDVVQVELLAAQFAGDRHVVPVDFRATADLQRSVTDLAHFEKKVRLPLIHDILQRAYDESKAEYLIYTNVDIGLYPDFYKKVNEFIKAGHDAFIINRRRLPASFTKVSDLNAIYRQTGKAHPGFDCFVFHRCLFPYLKLDGICIGVPFIEIAFSQNLFALAQNFKLFDSEVLTFHIGMEIFKKRLPREYFRYNRQRFHRVEKELLPMMELKKFPYQDGSLLRRFIRWGLHPCIPVRLALKLWWRGLFHH